MSASRTFLEKIKLEFYDYVIKKYCDSNHQEVKQALKVFLEKYKLNKDMYNKSFSCCMEVIDELYPATKDDFFNNIFCD